MTRAKDEAPQAVARDLLSAGKAFLARHPELARIMDEGLADRLVQVVVNPDAVEAHGAASDARGEYVLRVQGLVEKRREGTVKRIVLE